MRTAHNLFLLCLALLGATVATFGVFEERILLAFTGMAAGVLLFCLSVGIMHDLNTRSR